jgi:hypothetical protein
MSSGHGSPSRKVRSAIASNGEEPKGRLLRALDPHLLAAFAYVQTERTTGSDVQHFMDQPGHGAASLATDFAASALSGIILRHTHSVRRERSSVSLSPIAP